MIIQLKKFIPILLELYVVLVIIPVAFGDEPLQGSVKISKELPAVPPELRAGAIFNEANLPPMGTSQGWRWVPSWAAGTWHRETETDFLPTGPVTSLSRSMDEKQNAHQMDRQGGIWNHFSLPKIGTIELDKVIEWQITTDLEPILTNETQIVKRTRFMAIDVSKRNSKIVRVFQKEEFDTICPEGQGAVIQDAWLTVYNEKGRQLNSMRIQAHAYLTRPFEPINIDPKTGLDLRQDFKNYLMSHGLANLVPIDESAQISNSPHSGPQ